MKTIPINGPFYFSCRRLSLMLFVLAIYGALLLILTEFVFYFGSLYCARYRKLLQNTRGGHHLSGHCWMAWPTLSVSSIMRGKCLKASRDGLWIRWSGSLHLPKLNTPQWFSPRIRFPTLHASTWCLGRWDYFYMKVFLFIGVFIPFLCPYSDGNPFIFNVGGPRKYFASQDYWESSVNKPISVAWIKPLGSSSHFCRVPPWSSCWCISWATCGGNYWVRWSKFIFQVLSTIGFCGIHSLVKYEYAIGKCTE